MAIVAMRMWLHRPFFDRQSHIGAKPCEYMPMMPLCLSSTPASELIFVSLPTAAAIPERDIVLPRNPHYFFDSPVLLCEIYPAEGAHQPYPLKIKKRPIFWTLVLGSKE